MDEIHELEAKLQAAYENMPFPSDPIEYQADGVWYVVYSESQRRAVFVKAKSVREAKIGVNGGDSEDGSVKRRFTLKALLARRKTF